ncbi:MAG: hypothetical protein HUK15_03925 [Bacteroidales bacterium]|nr:hypothetical protein [Bacteroidales bacterium]
MKRYFIVLLFLLPSAVFSQQVVNGFGVDVFVGRDYKPSDNFYFNYKGEPYQASCTESQVIGGIVSFPFDFGVKRHRFTLAPAFEYRISNLSLNTGVPVKDGLEIKDGLSLSSTTYAPMIQFMYRPHFYIGALHMSIGIGAGFKYIVANQLEIRDNTGAQLVKYDYKADPKDIRIADSGAEYMAIKGLCIDPRISLDFYIMNSIMLSVYAMFPDAVASFSPQFKMHGQVGAGLVYMMRTKKFSESTILQQYKK